MALQQINWLQIDTANVPSGSTIDLGAVSGAIFCFAYGIHSLITIDIQEKKLNHIKLISYFIMLINQLMTLYLIIKI